MPSALTIDFASLLTPIAGDSPSGASLRYEGTYDAIQEQMDEDDDLERGEWQRETKSADWRGVIKTATVALTTKSKDLQIAAWLTRALVERHGFAGLRDGLRLLRELQEQFWDSLHPELEDGDAEFRAGPLEALNASLPLSIHQIVLTRSGDGEFYAWMHWEGARQVDNLARQNQEEALQMALAEGKMTGEQFTKAVTSTPRAFYEALLEDIQQSWEECEQLARVSDERFGRAALSVLAIKKAIDECRDLVARIRKEKREREGIKDEPETSVSPTPSELQISVPLLPSEETATTPIVSVGAVPFEPVNRTDALRRLDAIAAFFRRTEPHSPISYLVQRAARWGQMPLDVWLREVVKSDEVLSHIWETLGIKESDNDNPT